MRLLAPVVSIRLSSSRAAQRRKSPDVDLVSRSATSRVSRSRPVSYRMVDRPKDAPEETAGMVRLDTRKVSYG